MNLKDLINNPLAAAELIQGLVEAYNGQSGPPGRDDGTGWKSNFLSVRPGLLVWLASNPSPVEKTLPLISCEPN